MLNAETLKSIKQQAMQEVEKELLAHFKDKFLKQALSVDVGAPSADAKIELAESPAVSSGSGDEGSKKIADVSVMPEVRTAVLYGVTTRVAKDGSKVEAFIDGRWKERTINVRPDQSVPSFFIPTPHLNSGKASNQTSVILSRAVLQAFVGLPTYIEDVVLKHGERFLVGMKLTNHHDGNPRNNHLSNLSWVSEKTFVRAARAKLLRQLSK